MRTANVTELLIAAILAKRNICLVGSPGIGKTHIVRAAARACKATYFVMYPGIGDPTDAKGAPWIYQTAEGNVRAQFVAFEDLQQVYDAVERDELTVLFLDDLGTGTPATQASYMSLMDKLRGRCAIIAATNRRTDRAGVTGLLEPVKSRFHSLVDVDTHIDDWSAWACDNGIDPRIIGYLRNMPGELHKFEATQDMVNQPSPRTWHAVHDLLCMQLSPSTELLALQGAIGKHCAGQFHDALRLMDSMISPDAILLDPANADIPDDLSIAYAVSTALAYKANAQNFHKIVTYCERLHKARKSIFVALICKDAIRREPKIKLTPAWQKLASSSLGKLLMGESE